jgi:hypothetical protein
MAFSNASNHIELNLIDNLSNINTGVIHVHINTWSQVKVTNTADTTEPAEIAMNRQVKHAS